MITRDDIIMVLRKCNINQISELKNFIFDISKGLVIVSGNFPYSLAKQICSEKWYPSEIFISEEESHLPFEYFLTNSEIDNHLASFSIHSAFINNYDMYSQKYHKFKLELLNSAIERKEDLFLNKITIKSIPALTHTILCIKNFCSK